MVKNDDMTPEYAFEKYIVKAEDRANGYPLALFFHGPLSHGGHRESPSTGSSTTAPSNT